MEDVTASEGLQMISLDAKEEGPTKDTLVGFATWSRDVLCLPQKNPRQLAPLALAYLGDAVYELLIRTTVVSLKEAAPHKLNQLGVRFANARTQAQAVDMLWEQLTQEEQTFVQKGKNAKVGTIPKSCTPREYHLATGLECLLGYLFLSQRYDRIICLFGQVKRMIGLE